MKKIIILTGIAALMAGCFAPKELQVRVAPMGEEFPETIEQHMYLLPQTVLKVDIAYQEVQSVPGPYWEYAEKFLGITEVIRKRSSQWQIEDVNVATHTELDPSMVFEVNVLEGDFSHADLEPFLEKGLIVDGYEQVREEIKSSSLGTSAMKDYLKYEDLSIDSNFEERTETMYKTIVTDTSFVKVPVDRTITEKKSPAMKAEEAAEFILELRTRRFELLTGEYDGFPQGEAMSAALVKLDELEASYMTLFTGKTVGSTTNRAWFIVPNTGSKPSDYRLGLFSEQLGFVPDELNEGIPLLVRMTPLGKTVDMGAYYTGKSGEARFNRIFYRLPDVVEINVLYGNTEFSKQRISVYQSGALINAPIK